MIAAKNVTMRCRRTAERTRAFSQGLRDQAKVTIGELHRSLGPLLDDLHQRRVGDGRGLAPCLQRRQRAAQARVDRLQHRLDRGLAFAVFDHQVNEVAALQFVTGDLWVVAATVSWAAYALLQKVWPCSLSATARLAAICVGGVLALLPFAAWELTQPDLTVWGPRAVALVHGPSPRGAAP